MKTPVLILIVLFSCSARAQTHTIGGFVPTYYQSGNIHKKLDYSIFSFVGIHPMEQVRPTKTYPQKITAIHGQLDFIYNISKRWSVKTSFTLQRLNPFRDDYRNEMRTWLQLKYKVPFKRFVMINFLRYDFRFITNKTTSKIEYKPRLRYYLGFVFPFNNGRQYLNIYNQAFFNTYSTPTQAFAENWAYAGYGFSLGEGKRSKLEIGFLMASYIRDTDNNWTNQALLQTIFITRINLVKNNKIEEGMFEIEKPYLRSERNKFRGGLKR
ncbi:MAG: hypothetical protein ACI857_001783 [Arenicella sp.]|jgi:hypothetical protein